MAALQSHLVVSPRYGYRRRRLRHGTGNGFGQEMKAVEEDDGADLRMCAVVKVLMSLSSASAAVNLVAPSGVMGDFSSFRTIIIMEPCLSIYPVNAEIAADLTPRAGRDGHLERHITSILEDIASHDMDTGNRSRESVKTTETRFTACVVMGLDW